MAIPDTFTAQGFRFYVWLLIILAGVIAGRQFIAWFIMKLYDMFIRQNPLS